MKTTQLEKTKVDKLPLLPLASTGEQMIFSQKDNKKSNSQMK